MAVNESVTALAALVVALIALLVAAGQLLAQLLSTADGFRRCTEQVIGIWHKKRHRRFLFSEFRFETTFVTPEIVLYTPQEFVEAEAEFEEIQLVHLLQAAPKSRWGNDPFRYIRQSVHPSGAQRFHAKLGTRTSQIVPPQRQLDVEHGARLRLRKYGERVGIMPKTSSKQRRDNAHVVSWLGLLEELHSVFVSYWPKDCDVCLDLGEYLDEKGRQYYVQSGWSIDETALEMTNYHDIKTSLYPGDRYQPDRTDVAVLYRRWSWDFLPPDVVRPLATTNVGTIVVLALRMGMQWRSLEPEKGKMQADSASYSLSATDVRGLGIVLKLSRTGPQPQFPRIIPSRAGDKLLCGIIPGDPFFIREDFDFIGVDGKRNRFDSEGGVLERSGVPREKISFFNGKRYYHEVHNDLLPLICPFLPVRKSTITSFTSGAWNDHGSVLLYWEGKVALLKGIKKRLDGKPDSDRPNTLISIKGFLETAGSNFSNDFHCRWGRSIIWNNDEPGKKALLIQWCRGVHGWTTQELNRLGFHRPPNSSRIPYLQLLGAHANMAWKAVDTAHGRIKAQVDAKIDRSTEALLKRYDLEPLHEGQGFTHLMYEIGLAYVELSTDPEWGILKYLQDCGFRLDPHDAEVAWWLLMLRGIVWIMSTARFLPNGDPVSATFYSNKTPIWIT